MNICNKNGINTCADKTLQLPYVVMLELHFQLVLIRFLIALNRIEEPSDLQEFGTFKGEKKSSLILVYQDSVFRGNFRGDNEKEMKGEVAREGKGSEKQQLTVKQTSSFNSSATRAFK